LRGNIFPGSFENVVEKHRRNHLGLNAIRDRRRRRRRRVLAKPNSGEYRSYTN